MMSLFRDNIEKMQGYVPGEQLGGDYIKLNTNENPYPPVPAVLDAVKTAASDDLRLYPQPAADDLRKKAAEVYDLAAENVLAGNGSDELLTMAVRSFAGEGDTIASPCPSYSLYPVLAQIQGARMIEVPFSSDYSLPSALADTGAQLTFLSNPNSPAGTFIPVDDIAGLASELEGVLLVDEAYADFSEDNCLRLVKEFRNVIVTRSFSKSFSLAGVRLGLAFADAALISGMRKLKDSYNVNRLSIAAGVSALENISVVEDNVQRVKEQRTELVSELKKRGFEVIPSQANFVMARPDGIPAKVLYLSLKERKILIRHFDVKGLSEYVRISVGTCEQMGQLLGAIDDILSQGQVCR